MSGSMNDFVDPESIKNLRLCSGNIIYDNSLELVVLNDIICGFMSDRLIEAVSENFHLLSRLYQHFQIHYS